MMTPAHCDESPLKEITLRKKENLNTGHIYVLLMGEGPLEP
jgi:hypothetical protein